ncbi:hypothetical protein CC77DRAFT_1021657 [Alternaria alternata]|uniref:Uncharacterized protein n=2 Tax=Alternaria alternata complex TaxID=187734 RepID=A0A177DJ95_ALTAL|nr:hypothetical protein CC77DRAFT_1021657 [Alternaria alternata]OAG19566.1 hypothetical protein CC77DRAFT_1021657 [Alternaria alternata]RYN86289.1 hypothetical protein AA0119_g13041 [Alternaria tenuissima]RYO23546.1 hypothetical protein AA0121_g2214 [Alternaria tenuissima]
MAILNIGKRGIASGKSPIPPDLTKALLAALVPDPNDQPDVLESDIVFIARFMVRELQQSRAILTSILSSTYKSHCLPDERILWFMTAIAGPLTESANISIDRIVTALITAKVLADDCKEGDRRLLAIRSIFCLLGCLTFLYRPEPVDKSTALDIQMQDCSSFTTRSQQMQGSSRPFFEVVNVFNALGDLRTKQVSSDTSYAESRHATRQALLHPSHFNAAVLTKFGKVTIVWVDSIGAHLDFDAGTKKLSLFRLPSFIRVQSSDGALLPLCYSQYEKARDDRSTCDIAGLAREVLDTYSLLFGNDRRSKAVYRKLMLKASSDGMVDPLLDDLCGLTPWHWASINLSPPRPSIDADLLFPILSARMMKLQVYIESQGARGLRALYRDQRDSYQWWTFWAVIWLGGLNLLFAFTQNVLGSLQVAYAIKALNK